MSEGSKEARRGIWRQRRRRVVTGVNVVMAVILCGVAVVLVNVLASHFHYRVQLRSHRHHALSARTLDMLKAMPDGTKISIVAFLDDSKDTDGDATVYDDVRQLLNEYRYAAAKLSNVEVDLDVVDPQRDIARTRELAREHDISSGGVIVFLCDGRRKYVNTKNLVKYEINVSQKGISRRVIGFLGEQAFSSAIMGVAQKHTPVVYFLAGHGERDINDFSQQRGFSGIARIIRRDSIEVRALQLAQTGGIPDDCDALVVAGPDRKLSNQEVRLIDEYLHNRHGRAFFLLDTAVVTGLEGMLLEWGVALGKGIVVGAMADVDGRRELVVCEYGDHPITRSFNNVATMFYTPRPVTPSRQAEQAAVRRRDDDRAKVTVLASTGKEGWVYTDQPKPKHSESREDMGPVSVAVAVERGLSPGVDVELQSTRMVVVGDSHFVSNAALKNSMGGNPDFFMSSLNWLVERESLLRIAPRPPVVLKPDMSNDKWRVLFLITVVGIPGLIGMLGFVVWLGRRR